MLAEDILLIATYNHYAFIKRFSSNFFSLSSAVKPRFFKSVLDFAVAFWLQRPVN
jgi:hypothetical protein